MIKSVLLSCGATCAAGMMVLKVRRTAPTGDLCRCLFVHDLYMSGGELGLWVFCFFMLFCSYCDKRLC